MPKKRRLFKFSNSARIEHDAVKVAVDLCSNFIKQARYKKAFEVAKKTYKKLPSNRFALYLYAVSLGDSSEWVSKKQHLLNQKKAAKLFKILLRKSRGIDDRYIKVFRNEYYWFSKQPYQQYRLGKIYEKKYGKFSLYSSGVGAASIAVLKYKAKKPSQGKAWAKKAIIAWEGYFTADPNYYNAYVWYAKALGLSGDLDGMEKALKKAAKLSKRPLSYQEFTRARKEVLSLVKK